MGLRFRKSVKMGPFRINFSKTGIGWSVGAKGLRYTKKANGGSRISASVPGTGLSYTKDYTNRQIRTTQETFQISPESRMRSASKKVLYVYIAVVAAAIAGLLFLLLISGASSVKMKNRDAVYTKTIPDQSVWYPDSFIKFIAYPNAVSPGETALVEIAAAPRSLCSIIVCDADGIVENVALLTTETDYRGRAAWAWTVPSDTAPGIYYIEVSDRAGNTNRIDYSILNNHGEIVGEPPSREYIVDNETEGLFIEVEGYSSETEASFSTVYVASHGEKYHKPGCHHIGEGAIALAMDAAISQGYTPCSSCNP